MVQTVLILGASGKIGSHAKNAFQQAGWQVRVYDRSTNDMIAAARGVDVIVNGLNPRNYHNWAKLIPEITQQTIAAAKASGASVIIPGNVYNFGPAPGIWDENTPQNATTRKGRIRIEMEQAYRDAGVNTIILRAGNFIDPNGQDDVMGLVILPSIAKGKITAPGDPGAMQSYCYLPDWARAAVQLAEMRDQLATFEDIPFPGHSFTLHQLQNTLQEILGRDIRIKGFPWWLMRLSAPVWELARELNEMRYVWSVDHQLSATKFDRLLPGFEGTDLTTVIGTALPTKVNPNQPMPRHQRVTIR